MLTSLKSNSYIEIEFTYDEVHFFKAYHARAGGRAGQQVHIVVQPSTLSSFRTLHHPQNASRTHQPSLPTCPPPVLATTNLRSASVERLPLSMSQKCNRTVSILLFLPPFTSHGASDTHPRCGVCQPSFRFCRWVTFRYGHTAFYTSTQQLTDI